MVLNFIQALINTVFRIIPQPKPSFDQVKASKIVAHRGCHERGLVENTVPAFDWCVDHKIWGIELDVHFTSDNIAVIHHDPHCGRLFHQPQLIISQTSFPELRSKIPSIPSLQEIIERFGKKIHLMLEIKTVLTSTQNSILEHLLSSLKPTVDYHLLSLDLHHFDSISFVQQSCFMLVAELNLAGFVKQSVQKKYAGISGHYMLMSQSKMRLLRNNGINIGVGFIASKNSLFREINRGHDWVFTDCAVSVTEWMEELSKAKSE